jgi:hypothetical protein
MSFVHAAMAGVLILVGSTVVSADTARPTDAARVAQADTVERGRRSGGGWDANGPFLDGLVVVELRRGGWDRNGASVDGLTVVEPRRGGWDGNGRSADGLSAIQATPDWLTVEQVIPSPDAQDD